MSQCFLCYAHLIVLSQILNVWFNVTDTWHLIWVTLCWFRLASDSGAFCHFVSLLFKTTIDIKECLELMSFGKSRSKMSTMCNSHCAFILCISGLLQMKNYISWPNTVYSFFGVNFDFHCLTEYCFLLFKSFPNFPRRHSCAKSEICDLISHHSFHSKSDYAAH